MALNAVLSAIRMKLRCFIMLPFFILLSGCLESKPLNPLIVGSNTWVGFEHLYLTEKLRFYRSSDVKLIETPFSLTLYQALRNKSLDGIATSLNRIAAWSMQGINLSVVLVMDSSNGGDVLIAHPSIKSVADLKGKKIATSRNAVVDYLLTRALTIHNLSKSDVTAVYGSYQNNVEMFLNGEVDAIVTFGDSRFKALAGGGVPIFSSRNIPGEIIDVLCVRTDLLNSRPDKVRALIKGWIQTQNYLNAMGNESAYKPSLIKPDDFAIEVKDIKFMSIKDNIDYLKNNGAKIKQLLLAQLPEDKRAVVGAHLKIADDFVLPILREGQ
ncbi:ABC transporter substrate-binding protein [Temperatibacter marinus]|uniref:ABC transporter substrate-binding protein n=1 Tax=Temperatibacter marinus TaxID=1456591 RepID=A0AA52EFV1_9PROT|nr:ABC transporter substrate-binding protein [Temperatibacter marinus]WND04021.1 ABC transporter substrate-binding protein [Temperatibacter marinus]